MIIQGVIPAWISRPVARELSYRESSKQVIVQFDHWSGTEYAPNPNNAWDFNFDNGDQDDDNKNNNNGAWAVRSG